jgi:hypothetical protein
MESSALRKDEGSTASRESTNGRHDGFGWCFDDGVWRVEAGVFAGFSSLEHGAVAVQMVFLASISTQFYQLILQIDDDVVQLKLRYREKVAGIFSLKLQQKAAMPREFNCAVRVWCMTSMP